MTEPEVRDVPRMVLVLGTVATVLAFLVLAFTAALWWLGVAVTALVVGMALSPAKIGTPKRWNLAQSLLQAAGMGSIPAGITLWLATDMWQWAAVAAVVLVLCALFAAELQKPKHTAGGTS